MINKSSLYVVIFKNAFHPFMRLQFFCNPNKLHCKLMQKIAIEEEIENPPIKLLTLCKFINKMSFKLSKSFGDAKNFIFLKIIPEKIVYKVNFSH